MQNNAVTEYIRLEGNKIREVEVYFGSLKGKDGF
jgi:hypothetical protein